MVKALAYSATGKAVEAGVALDKGVFGAEPNHEIIGLAYRAYLANGRSAGASTLTRGLVRGGGKKPWRQKGTGRARVGSSRVPHWRGGGISFGPTGEENYEIKLSTTTKRTALRHALSVQAADKKVMVIDSFTGGDGKTKATVELLTKLEVNGNILFVVADKTPMVDRATRNVAGLKVKAPKYINVFDALNADAIIISKEALPVLSDWLTASVSSKKTVTTQGDAS